MKNSQTREQLIKEYIIWAQDKDICDQCIRPWHDGLCTCSSNNHKISLIKDIALELIHQGNNLNHL